VVMTSWAILSLLQSGIADSEPVRAGLRFLQDRQRPDGSWPEEAIAGVFNRTCAITYDNYRKIFGLWALAAGETRRDAAAAGEGSTQ
jgi:squalene cyclase